MLWGKNCVPSLKSTVLHRRESKLHAAKLVKNIWVYFLSVFLSWTSTWETSLWWTSLSGTCQRGRTRQSRLHWSCALSWAWAESSSPLSPTAFAVSSAGTRGLMPSGNSPTYFNRAVQISGYNGLNTLWLRQTLDKINTAKRLLTLKDCLDPFKVFDLCIMYNPQLSIFYPLWWPMIHACNLPIVRTHSPQWRLPSATQAMQTSGAPCWRPSQMLKWRRRSETKTGTQGETVRQIEVRLIEWRYIHSTVPAHKSSYKNCG